MIYDIETIPIITFYKIAETKNIRLLTDDDSITDEELYIVWDKIRNDYTELEDNPVNKKIEDIKKRIIKKQNEYDLVKLCLQTLSLKKVESVIDILKKYRYEFNGKLSEDIEIISKQSDNLKIVIDNLNKELEKLCGDDSDKKSSIYQIIANLSVGLGIPIDPQKLLTITFIFNKKALLEKIKSLNKN